MYFDIFNFKTVYILLGFIVWNKEALVYILVHEVSFPRLCPCTCLKVRITTVSWSLLTYSAIKSDICGGGSQNISNECSPYMHLTSFLTLLANILQVLLIELLCCTFWWYLICSFHVVRFGKCTGSTRVLESMQNFYQTIMSTAELPIQSVILQECIFPHSILVVFPCYVKCKGAFEFLLKETVCEWRLVDHRSSVRHNCTPLKLSSSTLSHPSRSYGAAFLLESEAVASSAVASSSLSLSLQSE